MLLEELRLMQNYPLWMKVEKSKQRIREFIEYIGEDSVYISFSGGKDSTVLLHLVRSIYPNVEAVFSNTGLEYPELVDFVKSKENVTMVRPKKSFKQVIEDEGYPIVSKKVARAIRDLQNPTENNVNIRNLYITGKTMKGYDCPSRKLPKKWYKLIDAPFKVSEKCCDNLKKNPIKQYERLSKKRPIIGTMAAESKMREKEYIKSGCNSFKEGKENCTPLGFWTEQDILQYIYENKLEIASVYGDIVKADGKLKTTGEQRTGCIFCAFGCHMEVGENRFQRLKKTHPKLHGYCMDQLGMREVLEYIDVKCE